MTGTIRLGHTMPDDIVQAALRQVKLHGMERELLDTLIDQVRPGDLKATIRQLMRAVYKAAQRNRKSYRDVARELDDINFEIDKEFRKRCIANFLAPDGVTTLECDRVLRRSERIRQLCPWHAEEAAE